MQKMKDLLKAFTSKFRISSEKKTKIIKIGNVEDDAIIHLEGHYSEEVHNIT